MYGIGRKAFITGISTGIGREMARQLVAAGWKVAGCGRNTERLKELEQELGKDNVYTESIDINDVDSDCGLRYMMDKWGCPDIYIHVAGIGWQNPGLDQMKEMETVRTNAESFVKCVSAVYNYFKDHLLPGQTGRIAAVTSLAATKGMGAAPAYSATKKMQSAYLQALAQLSNMDGSHIGISEIAPGFVDTGMLDSKKRYPLKMSCPKAVSLMLKGLMRGRRKIVIDWKFRIIGFIWRMIPGRIWEKITFIG